MFRSIPSPVSVLPSKPLRFKTPRPYTLTALQMEQLTATPPVRSEEHVEEGTELLRALVVRSSNGNTLNPEAIEHTLDNLLEMSAQLESQSEIETALLNERDFLQACQINLEPNKKTLLLEVLQSATCIKKLAPIMEDNPSSIFLQSWRHLLMQESQASCDTDFDTLDTGTLETVLEWLDLHSEEFLAAKHSLEFPNSERLQAPKNPSASSFRNKLSDEIAKRKLEDLANQGQRQDTETLAQLFAKSVDTFYELILPVGEDTYAPEAIPNLTTESLSKEAAACLIRILYNESGRLKHKGLQLRMKGTQLQNKGESFESEGEQLKIRDEQRLKYLLDYLPYSSLEHVDHCIEQWVKTLEEHSFSTDFAPATKYHEGINVLRAYLQQHRQLKQIEDQAEEAALIFERASYQLAGNIKTLSSFPALAQAAELQSSKVPQHVTESLGKSTEHFQRSLKKFETDLTDFWGCSAQDRFDSDSYKSKNYEVDVEIYALQRAFSQKAALKKQNERKIQDRLQASFDAIDTSRIGTRPNTDSEASSDAAPPLSEWPASTLSQFVDGAIRQVFSDVSAHLDTSALEGMLAAVPLESLSTLNKAYGAWDIPKSDINISASIFKSVAQHINTALSALQNLPAEIPSLYALKDKLHVLDILPLASLESMAAKLPSMAIALEGIYKELEKIPSYLEHFYKKIEALSSKYWSESECDIPTLEKHLDTLTQAHNHQPSSHTIEAGRFKNIVDALKQKLQTSCEKQAKLFYANMLEKHMHNAIETYTKNEVTSKEVIQENARDATHYFYTLFSNIQKLTHYHHLSAADQSETQTEIALISYITEAIQSFSLEQQEMLLLTLRSDAAKNVHDALFTAATSLQEDRPQKSAQLLALAHCLSTPIKIVEDKLAVVDPDAELELDPQFNLAPLFDAYKVAIKERLYIDLSHLQHYDIGDVYPILEDLVPNTILKMAADGFKKVNNASDYIQTAPNILISSEGIQDFNRRFTSELFIDGKKYDFNLRNVSSYKENDIFFRKQKFIIPGLLQDFCKNHEYARNKQDELVLLSSCISQASCFISPAILSIKSKALLLLAGAEFIPAHPSNSNRLVYFHLDRQHNGTVLLRVIFREEKIATVRNLNDVNIILPCDPENSFAQTDITLKIDVNKLKEEQITLVPGSASYKYNLQPAPTEALSEQPSPASNHIPNFTDSVTKAAQRLQTTAKEGIHSIMSTPLINKISTLA